MLSCRKSNANVWNNNLETQDFRTASRVQPTFSRRFEKSTRPTDCAVPAPGVMNGAPTGYAANQPPQNNIRPPRKRTGATCDARMTTAKQHSTARKRRGATRDARMTTAKQHSTTPKRRGATRDAWMTDAMPRTGRNKTANRLQHATSTDTQRGRPIVPFRHRAS